MVNAYSHNTTAIRLVIADDHSIFRKGLSTMLNQHSHLQIVGEAGNGQELVEVVLETKPDVVLTDINMPKMCGIEATSIMKKQFPDSKVIALSMHDSEQTINRMWAAGAKGYLLKDTSEFEMVHAVQTVFGNGLYYCTTTLDRREANTKYSAANSDESKINISFTVRDIQIIQLLCQEKGSKEIAATLNINCRAVEGARQRIQEKIGARNMIGIAIYAIKYGLFSPE